MSNKKLEQALSFAKEKHKEQVDDDGKSYFEAHVLQVFQILSLVTDDMDVLCAGLLHDTVEDTDTTYEEIVERFGERVADLVMEMTHEGNKDQYGYYFPRLHSSEGILIKFADRLSNLSRMGSWNENRKRQYLRKSKFWRSACKR